MLIVHCACNRLYSACNRLTVGLIYMAGFMGFDAQCKMAVGTTPTTAWRVALIWNSHTLLL